ncbi:MAG: hypothetical protein Fur003_3610 [Candidatus Dojkabacteria bacterium]
MALLNDQVVVIKSVNYGEADKILTVYGHLGGKFALIAKGLRKIESKSRGNMQTLSLSRISYFEGQTMGILRESELIATPDINKIEIKNAERVLLVMNKLLPEAERDDAIFEKFSGLIKGEFSLERVNRFRMLLLRELGYLPDMNVCVLTGSTEGLKYFDPALLGLVSTTAVEAGVAGSERAIQLSEVGYASTIMTNSLDNYIRTLIN